MTGLRIRQLVIAANSLDTAEMLQDILGLGEPFPDPGVGAFGLVNAVFPIGDQFLEVVVPVTPDAPARRFIGRFGEGGYMAIFQVPGIQEARARGDALGIRRVWNYDSDEISASHFHPADIGGAIVSLDQPAPPESWKWGGPHWRENTVPGALTGLTAQSPTPDDMARKWAGVLGAEDKPASAFETEDGPVTFQKADQPGIPEFHLAVPDVAAALTRAAEKGCNTTARSFDLAGVSFILSSL